MSERSTLEALLARVSAGTGPDRELDRAIAMALTPKARRGMYVRRHYTTSLDAARTLVPPGWHSLIGDRPDWPWVQMWEFPPPCRKVLTTNAPTIQRALIAACVKARMEALGE